MNYLINDSIIYDSKLGLLYIDAMENAIKLTTTLNRLLLVLIQNNNEVLDREILLKRVWEEHDQVVSDNNLNSSISVLRRHLSSLSHIEIITTIPKVGIKFSAIINNIDETDSKEKVSIAPSIEQPIEKDKVLNSYILNNKYLEIGLIAIIIFCLVYLFKNYFFTTRIEYPVVGQIDQCTIRYINSYHKPDTRTINFTNLKEKLNNLDLDCKKSATLFYYDMSIVTNTKNKDNNYLFLSYCPTIPKKNTTVNCENFYVQ
ncbi:winged helix-turn-helix domain-containing protein [Proteus mirabilis]